MEDVTLKELQQYCHQHPSHHVIYVHPKGSFHPRKSQDWWRKEGTMTASSEGCHVPMMNNECNACGARLALAPPHFSGNFWRASCRYVQELLPIQDAEPAFRRTHDSLPPETTFALAFKNDAFLGFERYAAEQWIGSHPNFKPCSVGRYRPLRKDVWALA